MQRTSNDSSIEQYHDLALRHRREHGCGGYPYENGRELQQLIRDAAAGRVLELGTAVGFSAFCFATAAADIQVDTIERDSVHVTAARDLLASRGVGDRVSVHAGEFAAVLPSLTPGYDLTFVDGFEPQPDLLEQLDRLTMGVLVSANLSWAGNADDYLARLARLGWRSKRRGDIAVSRKEDAL